MGNGKDRVFAGAALLLCAALLSGFGMMVHREEAGGINEQITGVMNEEEEPEHTKIALTFDDGPDPVYTPQLLDGLKEREAKATFFLMGKQAESYPELVKRIREEGHLIGNHTYSHLQLNKNNREAFKAELVKTNELLLEITGEETAFVRPPYGSWDKELETELTMLPVLWTIDPLDWCSDNVQGIVKKVTDRAEENAIILMHDAYPSSVTAALEIVDLLEKQGYEFVTVDEIILN
ncbi:MAG: polysaccharide deacetylase family protein [Bacteroidales bacterium]|nr:polysaccharide deacetylase family protein [Bacteroidales bacterium]MCM1415255.1 polysaccharide deacetylase family protein [bacterium]MCM1423279.1 polysaccharide deacetylase family protein [bacterium]